MSDSTPRELNDYAKEAIHEFGTALAAARGSGDKHGEAENLWKLGSTNCWHTDDGIDLAIEYHQQAIAIAREIGDKRQEADNLEGLGDCYGSSWHDKRDYPQATVYFEQALAIAREIGDRKREGDCLNHLGRIQSHHGDTEQALSLYQEALTIAQETGDKSAEGQNLHSIGLIKYKSENYPQAIQYIEQSISACQSLEGTDEWIIVHPRIAHNTGDLARIYYDLKDYRKASELYERGLTMAREIDTFEIDTLNEETFAVRFERLKNDIDHALGNT
jgi:tetratricopeptide (TPR) repeat protein